MRLTLMHRDFEVAEFEVDEATGSIGSNIKVLDRLHMPPGTIVKQQFLDKHGFSRWWIGRCIPMSRTGVRDLLDPLGISLPSQLLTKSMGLSLSDSYWVRERSSDTRWKDVNFFDNDFSEDIGRLLFGQTVDTGHMDFSSPDVTSEGNLRKRWTIIDGHRCLIKGGSGPYKQEPFNEAMASCICRELGIQHVDYDVMTIDGFPYSLCEDFVDGRTEYIAASHILESYGSLGTESVYDKFVRICSLLDLDIVPFLNDMIVLDYIIANDDRHLNNFGLLRNPETLEWLGMAPIFDSGTSLGYDRTAERIPMDHDVMCKPFKNHHDQQLKLVSSLDWVDFEALSDLDELVRDTMSGSLAQGCVGADRIEAIAQAVRQRVQRLQQAAQSQQSRDLSSTADDVEQNVAQSYQ